MRFLVSEKGFVEDELSNQKLLHPIFMSDCGLFSTETLLYLYNKRVQVI